MLRLIITSTLLPISIRLIISSILIHLQKLIPRLTLLSSGQSTSCDPEEVVGSEVVDVVEESVESISSLALKLNNLYSKRIAY
jgi:hypothetical protein